MSIQAMNVSQMLRQEVGEIKDYEYIALLRKRIKLSQNELYTITGILPQHLSEYETGKRELTTPQIIQIIKVLKERNAPLLSREKVL